MDAKRFEEMANDPILGKAVREIGSNLNEGRVEMAANQAYGGHASGGGMPTDNTRLREITQDRPNPVMPVYALATPTPVNATEQSTIRDNAGVDLSWHRDLMKTASPTAEAQKDMTKDRGQGQPEQTQQKQPEHTRDPQGRGR